MSTDRRIPSSTDGICGAVFNEGAHYPFGLIDANPQAIILLDDRRHIATANRTARALIAADDGFVTRCKTLELSNPAENAKLQDLIGRALAKDRATAGAMRALRPSGGRSYSILVSPIRGANHAALAEAQSAVRVMIVDPENHAPVSAECLQALYGLTSAEAKLAQRLAAAEELRTAAAKLGIGYGTARAQLSAIFRKTETSRQGELVRLLCALPPSLP